MKITSDQALTIATKDVVKFWNDSKTAAASFTGPGRMISLMALKRFLRDNGIYPPNDRLRHPRRKLIPANLSWNQGLAICGAASKPYNLAFKLMLHCGWGIGEFFKFNSAETWQKIRDYLAQNPTAAYYRHDFPEGRKMNNQPFYTLIPANIIKEIFDSGIPLPMTTLKVIGQESPRPLNFENYESNTTYLHRAFRTAVRRAPVKVDGRITLHELRDTFLTHAHTRGVPYENREFALGHSIDPRGYDKIWRDPDAMWQEMSKAYAENGGGLRAELDSRDEKIKELSRQIENIRQERADEENKREPRLKDLERLVTSQKDQLDDILGKVPKLGALLDARDSEIIRLRRIIAEKAKKRKK